MSSVYPLLRSLDPYHARIGYLGALAMVATRDLDRPDALMARFQNLIFERIYPDDRRFHELMGRIDESRRVELLKRRRRPEEEDPAAGFSEVTTVAPDSPPADWLLAPQSKRPQPKLVQTEWLYISEFWLYDRVMPSPLGPLTRDKAHRTIDLARWTNLLLPTLELSETGYLMQHLLTVAANKARESGLAPFNPLNPAAHPTLPLLYFRLVLQHEMLLPFLVLELVETHPGQLATRGREGLLLRSVDRMLGEIGDVTDQETVLDVRNLDEFREAIQKKDSTQENYLRPRLEMLVDLGLLGRRSADTGGRAEFAWEATHRTRALVNVMRPLAAHSNTIPAFLDENLFSSWACIVGTVTRRSALMLSAGCGLPWHLKLSDMSSDSRMRARLR